MLMGSVKVEMARKSAGSTESVSLYSFSRDPILQQLTIAQANIQSPYRLQGKCVTVTGDLDGNQRHAATYSSEEANALVTKRHSAPEGVKQLLVTGSST
jgi:hypothetical protein